jgi:hypothetical protein
MFVGFSMYGELITRPRSPTACRKIWLRNRIYLRPGPTGAVESLMMVMMMMMWDVKAAVVWVVSPCCLIEVYWYLKGGCIHRHQVSSSRCFRFKSWDSMKTEIVSVAKII